jgi:hypothetical protein
MADYQYTSNPQTYVPPNYYSNNPYNPPVQQHHTTNTVVVQQPSPVIIIQKQSAYPELGKCLALIILIINIVLPGVGTIIMGCCSSNCGEWFCTGILQILLTVLLIGWIWSICTGINCLNHSR